MHITFRIIEYFSKLYNHLRYSINKMRAFYIILFVTLFNICLGQNNNPVIHLFPITEQNKIGFIDSSGMVIIKPVFLSAGEFSEGLAPARIAGAYGYVDNTGKFIIRPQYDYALNFNEGLAIVYIGGKPFFINKAGQKIFENSFAKISPFKNGRSIVQNSTGKYGCIDKTGKLIIDTIHIQINPFIDGRAVVRGYEDKGNNIERTLEYGVIDTMGRFIIPYGSIEYIKDLNNGYFGATLPADSNAMHAYYRNNAILDRNGNLLVFKNSGNNSSIEGVPHDGLIKMQLLRDMGPEAEMPPSTYKNIYAGYINLKGEMIIDNDSFKEGTDFSNNRAFVRDKSGKYSIIDTKGKIIKELQFDAINATGFVNGKAFVLVSWKWGLIDTNGVFLIKPQYSEITPIDKNHFFFTKRDSSANSWKLNGVSSIDGRVLIKPIIQDYNRKGFQNGLLKCTIDNKASYINLHGTIVWQEKEIARTELRNLNIDHMNNHYFRAASRRSKYDVSYDSSANSPKRINNSQKFLSDKLNLIVRPDMKVTFNGQYNGFVAFVANTTPNNYLFRATDEYLSMNIQALDEKGQWRDIDYALEYHFLCGYSSSASVLCLAPQEYWSFCIPAYEGGLKTKLRLKLICNVLNENLQERKNSSLITIYSNEFKGSINPGQFWRIPRQTPNGLMDLYDDRYKAY